MVTDYVKELKAVKARVAALEAQITAERDAALAAVPSKYGFADATSFVAAFYAAIGKSQGRKSSALAGAPSVRLRRKRARITDATRLEVQRLVQAGKTGNEIAALVGISPPSVQNVKKALGLVRHRKR